MIRRRHGSTHQPYCWRLMGRAAQSRAYVDDKIVEAVVDLYEEALSAGN